MTGTVRKATQSVSASDSQQGCVQDVAAAAVRVQVERILANPPFVRSDRLSRFLRFAVERTIQGEGHTLKEYVLGIEVFDKPESFDPRSENIVRVEARRLRTSLVEYYAAAGADDPILIEFPKGTYAPVFSERSRSRQPADKAAASVRWRTGAVVATLFVFATVSLAVLFKARTQEATSRLPSSVAVLPFTNLTGNPDLEYLGDAVAEELTNTLSRNSRLSVAARTSAFQFKERAADVRQIGKQLGVQLLVEGTIQKTGERLRTTARLIRVSDGFSLWSAAYERDRDLAGIHEQVATGLIHAMGHTHARDQDYGPTDPEAWALYQKGRYFWQKWTPESVRKSIDFFEEALGKDPGYALAWAGLADAWGVLGHWGVLPPREAAPKRDAALNKALSLNAEMPEVRVPLAMKKAYYEWDWSGAEEEFRRIVEHNPSSGEVYRSYALVLMARGKFEEAERQLLFALKLEPLLLAANLAPARLLHYRRHYQAAIRQANKVLEMDAGFHPAYVVIGQAYERLNQHREAIEALKRAAALAPSNSEVTAALAHAYGRSGDRRAAEKLLRDLQSFSRTRRISPVDFAVIHIGLGQTSEALNQLDRAYEDRDGRLVQLKVNPVYDSMHSEARYRALLKRINLER